MKAYLLAAGRGTRLSPLTDTTPKCLIPIDGKPILKIWIELFERHDVHEVLVNLHHHADQVGRYLAGIQDHVRIKIKTVFEKRLLGSGGTILQNQNFAAGCEDFIIAYADTLSNVDLKEMVRFHRCCVRKGGVLTMGLFRTPDPRNCGIADLDSEKKVVNFIEKPQNPTGNLANAGIYVASGAFFNAAPAASDFRKKPLVDLGFDILPALVGRMYGYPIKAYLKDIGTLDAYHDALREWPIEKKRSYETHSPPVPTVSA